MNRMNSIKKPPNDDEDGKIGHALRWGMIATLCMWVAILMVGMMIWSLIIR